MSFDPVKDAEAAAERVADHIGQAAPGIVQSIADALGADRVTITIPAIVIEIAFGKKSG